MSADPSIYTRLADLERRLEAFETLEQVLLGSGTVGRIPQWNSTGRTLEDSTLAKTGAGLVTINAASAYTLELSTGSWTPKLGGTTGAGSFTYAAQVGRYMRIGKLIVAAFYVQISAVSVGAAGNALATDLPFTAANIANYFQTVCITQYANMPLSPGHSQLTGRIDQNTNFIQLLGNGSGVGAGFVPATSLGVNSQLLATAIYEAA